MTAVKLLVQIVVTMMAPAVFRRHRERERGREPPPSSSSLTFPLDGRRVSPLVHGLHGGGGAGAPPGLDLSLFPSVSTLPDSGLSPFLKFPEIHNSDWAEFWTQSLSRHQLSCGEIRAPTSLQDGHEGPGRKLDAKKMEKLDNIFFAFITHGPQDILDRFLRVTVICTRPQIISLIFTNLDNRSLFMCIVRILDKTSLISWQSLPYFVNTDSSKLY